MKAQLKLSAGLVALLVFFSCKKSSNSTTSTTLSSVVNIDSMVGYYAGTTTGDSIYYYRDSVGDTQQWVHSFSIADTLIITSVDTISITVSSKLYSLTFPYGDSLTFAYVTNLQYIKPGANGATVYNAAFTDTTDGPNHVILNVEYGYQKSLISSVTLYKRP